MNKDTYDPAVMEQFIAWLVERGAEMRELTNEWELVRFGANGGTGVIYRNKHGVLKMSGPIASAAWASFHVNGSWANLAPVAAPPEKTLTFVAPTIPGSYTVSEMDGQVIISPRDANSGLTDEQRYQRIRVLGAAPGNSPQLNQGTVLRFQSLDMFLDADIAANPSRGEWEELPVVPSRVTAKYRHVIATRALGIANLINDTDSDDRAALYDFVADELVSRSQNYQASHFRALAKAERGG